MQKLKLLVSIMLVRLSGLDAFRDIGDLIYPISSKLTWEGRNSTQGEDQIVYITHFFA